MENPLEISTTKTSQWIECESKKTPGKKYLFNKSTGESKWLSSKQNKDDPPPLEVKKSLKTPANERLKRLQHKLRTENKNVELEKLPTSSASSNKNNASAKNPKSLKSPANERLKFLQQNALTKKISTKKEDNLTNQTPVKRSLKKNIVATEIPATTSKSSLLCSKHKEQKTFKISTTEEIKKPAKDKTLIVGKSMKRAANDKKCDNETKEKTLNNNSLNIIKRFKIPKKITDSAQTSQNNDEQILKSKKCNLHIQEVQETKERLKPVGFKIKKQTSVNVQTEKPNDESELRIESSDLATEQTPQLKFLQSMPDYNSTPKSHLRQSANQRLNNLRQTFQNENNALKCSGNSTIPETTANDDCEEMDWEPSFETYGNVSIETNDCVPTNRREESPTQMEIDDNLMLTAADENLNYSKWRPFHLYIIVDTNVFISQLNFLKFLKNQKPDDAAGIVFYLPYSVLQELDKLKMRENIKCDVQNAIRYLNTMFESKDEHVQAQSALENRRHLIDIESSDDKILNCCLQVREHASKVLLLSEDINLRNKAICSDIVVFTKSDFATKGFPKI